MVRSRKTENRQTSDVKSLFTPKEMSQVSQEVNSKRVDYAKAGCE